MHCPSLKRNRGLLAGCARWTGVWVLLSASAVLLGCGQSGSALTASEKQSFDSAPAEVKQMWTDMLAADKANEYTKTQTLLEALRLKDLSEEQKAALEKRYVDFGQRLWAAAEKNDAAATKALIEWRNSQRGKHGTQ